MPDENCPVCERTLEVTPKIRDYGNRKSIECPRCGDFEIAAVALLEMRFPEMRKEERIKLSSWIRTKRPSDLVITNENLDDILQNLPSYRISEQQLLLLQHLEDLTNYPGEQVQVPLDNDYTVIGAHNADELLFHLDELDGRGFIKNDKSMRRSRIVRVTMTASGWNFLADHPVLSDVGNQAFVAMSFSEPMKAAFYDGIKPALERAGYRAYPVDQDPHIQRIDTKIEHEIRNSAFVVADVTEQKQGVYYEAGFAKGLGRPVIWAVREDELDKVHFDTRQYSHIVWTNETELQERLYHLVFSVLPEVRGRWPKSGGD